MVGPSKDRLGHSKIILIQENRCRVKLLNLEFCSRSDLRYREIRDRHYIPNRGAHAQQLHFIVHDGSKVAGIISAGSSVYSVKSRNDFFSIPGEREVRQSLYLPAIVNNTVFRLENSRKNLGTETLALWRKVTAELWLDIYGVPVIGFETFIIEQSWRRGSMYLADNWTHVGTTAGSTKAHNGLTNKSSRLKVEQKMVFCRWAKKPVVPKDAYVSSWRASTPEEKADARAKANKRKELLGVRFDRYGRR